MLERLACATGELRAGALAVTLGDRAQEPFGTLLTVRSSSVRPQPTSPSAMRHDRTSARGNTPFGLAIV